ncbi:VWA domain-containing protein [Novosphingobium sp.]|uniref:vWA domain-containing protein n=1 Tax=Novosphingobium sp. TaxID=1874826 RepID=UPI0025FA8362|nr:vWA domain-containing protein [Novosphingobium sp.]
MRHKLSRGVTAAVVMTLLVPQPAQSQREPAAGGARNPVQRSQCRTPAALPDLGSEAGVPPFDVQVPYATMEARAIKDKGAPPPPPVAAPPMAVSAADSTASEAIVAAGSRIDRGERTTAADKSASDSPVDAKVGPRRPRPYPQRQSGLLTAGEHDDLLNPELYAAYVRRSDLGQQIADLPQLDTARILTVEIKDFAGNPLGRSLVEVQCADGNRLLLQTMSDGTVTLFPGLDNLSPSVKVRALNQDWRVVTIPRGAGGQRITFTSNAVAVMAPPKLDLMLAIDTTGSMGDEIRYLQSELAAILDAIRTRHPGLDIRVGFVFYRDVGDDYVTNTVPLTRDFAAAQGALAQRYAGGGGDYPEAMDQALVRAARQDWRRDAVKSLLLVADAPPHDENMGMAWRAAEHLRANRVHIVAVAASGVADKAEYAMRAMAALTQSRYLFLTDDSGVGNSHAAPAIDCYLVTRLDALLRRVIDSQIAGRRIEPKDSEVIREVGQYDRGRCIIPRSRLPEQ